jgi:Putative MetA-pathway of phenol degradation
MKHWNSITKSGMSLMTLFCLIFCLSTSALGAAETFTLSLGFDFASGDYGTAQTTDSYRVPLTIGYVPTDRLDFTLEIPYLYQSNSSTVSLGGMRFPMRNSGSGPGGMGGTTSSMTASQNGLGDVNLTAGVVLLDESETTPMIRPLAYVKAPTADKDKGLGTGAFDFGGGLSVGKDFGDWALYTEALYVVPGSSSVYKPDNYWTYQGSVSHPLTPKLDAGVEISGATAAFSGNSGALEVQLKTSYQISPRGSLGGSLSMGLSNSSPDYTAGVYGAINF